MGFSSDTSEKGIVKAVQKSLQLLKFICNQEEEVGLAELSKAFSSNPSTLHHLLKTLLVEGYISQNKNTKKYSPGSEIFNSWIKNNHMENYFQRVLPILRSYVDRIGETTSIFTQNNNEAICVIGWESTHILRAFLLIGRRIPLYCTASGKMLLALKGPADLNSYLIRCRLHKYFDNTIVNPKALTDEVNAIRQQGYAIEMEEYEELINALSVPIYDKAGAAFSVLTTIAPANRLTRDRMLEILPILKDASKEITNSLFGEYY